MSLTITGNADPNDFAARSSRWEGRGRKVRCQDAEGSLYDAYEVDGQVVGPAMRTPSAAWSTRVATAKSSEDAIATRRAAALTVVKNQVARVRAIPAATRTDQDKWLLALSFLVLREE